MQEMKFGFLGFGSNIGAREIQIRRAIDRLASLGMHFEACSSFYETPPWGKSDQPAFLNLVAYFGFAGTAYECLDLILDCERALGRKRSEKWGPRSIDIDILSFGEEAIRSQRLTVPHPFVAERAFVLVPWAEIAPDHRIVGLDKTVEELLAALEPAEIEAIRKLDDKKAQ